MVVDPETGFVTPFITGLPTGDHPTEQLAFKGDWIYWSQGSTTNSGVVGRDNGGGTNQQDIPCQDIVLSNNVFNSGGSPDVMTSGYSAFGVQRKGATVHAFESALHHGVCDGAILRARLDADNPEDTIEPYSWGYRNGYAIRFAPRNHALEGQLLVGEDGADERGARPSNNAPDNLQLAIPNPDGSPDYHGWPDQYGFLSASQAVFNPIGGPGDDLCVPDPTNLPSTCTPASLAQILSEDVPIKPVLAFPPQEITSPLATEAANSSFTGIDFVPASFVRGPVRPGAALYVLEGDFGFSASNATEPAHEVGHEVKLINFSRPGKPLELEICAVRPQQHIRSGVCKRHPRCQSAHQRADGPGRLCLGGGLWRSARFRPVRRRHQVRRCRQRAAGANPRHRRDLADLPAIGQEVVVGGVDFGQPRLAALRSRVIVGWL